MNSVNGIGPPETAVVAAIDAVVKTVDGVGNSRNRIAENSCKMVKTMREMPLDDRLNGVVAASNVAATLVAAVVSNNITS